MRRYPCSKIGALDGDKLMNAMKRVIVDIIGSKAHSIGWDIVESDDDTMITFKVSMFSNAGLAGDQR